MRLAGTLWRAVAPSLALSVVLASPLAFAQKKPDPKKKKPAATAPAPAEALPAPEATPPPATSAAPAPAEPSTTAAATTSASATADAPPLESATSGPVDTGVDTNDPTERPGERYYFVGLRYRGTVIPKFMLNLFVDEGATVYSNSIGVEFDIRKDGFSLIPSIAYTEYGTGGPMLFHQKGQPTIPQNYSVVDSSLKAIYLGADLLWSADISKTVQFEYGAGFGIGVIFGDLGNNWVYDTPNGPYTPSGNPNLHLAPCQTVMPGTGCDPHLHQDATVNKVGGYTEPSWINGGSKPNIFPHVAFPELGIRFKPIKQFVARATVGFSLTGFFFGLSGNYGLPEKK